MLNHNGSTIDRHKIIVKWGIFRPWRTPRNRRARWR